MESIVITGSTRGIGYAMAKEFLKSGCNVTLSGRGDLLPDKSAEGLKDFAGHFIYVSCNVQDKEGLQRLWDVSADRWGTIDVWINNAGQNAPHAFVCDTAECYTASIIATNITGMIYGSQVAADGMLRQQHGAIYNMEGLGSNNMIQPRTILYGTTKHALTYFTKGLAQELQGSGVTAGRLSPGMMLTEFITRTPDGEIAAIERDESFKKIFNILGDRPETVAAFFIPRILANKKNNVQIAWLTGPKAAFRFLCAPFRKGRLV
ncbi:MAG: SDR family oxidoreductase [Saccharofermentanales bacterium]